MVDTTILIYAVGEEHPLREPSRRIVTAIMDGRVDARTTAEVVQEFVHVRARRQGRPDAVTQARFYADLLSPLLAVERGDLDTGLRLYEEHPKLGSFDAVLAAVASSHDAQALISADRAFAAVPRLRYVDPSTSGLNKLLGE